MKQESIQVPIARTSLKEEDFKSVLEPLRSGWLVQGPKVKEFEKQWSDFTGCSYSVAVTSCTSALQLSLIAAGFKAGDEAIVPAFTWVSTANVVELLGGKVIFCDIELNTFNIDVSKIEALITERTKAIIPVHLFGLAADMTEIMRLSEKYNLAIIEDAACGFGCFYNGKHVGNLGHTGCFSFHPRKSITTGEGGMITTNDEDVMNRLKMLRDHGAEITDLQRHLGPRPYLLADHPVAGFNQRMTDFQAALGSAQMKRANEILSERKKLATFYDFSFQEVQWLRTPPREAYSGHGFQSYACLFEPEELNLNSLSKLNSLRNSFMDKLNKCGISTRPATHAVHMLSFYKEKYKLTPKDFPNAFIANDCSISFPLFNGMQQSEQDYVVSRVLDGF
jgi:perosamine synthetase